MEKKCEHSYKLIQIEDAKIEPEWIDQNTLSNRTKTYKCEKCGHIKTVIGAN